jgi:quercetin dioxygenase-like cupin family protein
MNWNSITVETVGEGIRRQMVTGDRLMMCRLQMAPHTITPVHSHPHEQITIIEQGRVRFHVDGTDRIVSAGDSTLVVQLENRIDPAINARAISLA